MGILSIPNSLSFSRIFILVPFVYAILNQYMVLASVLLLVSYSTDAADGILARRMNQASEFGAILDVSVDKITLVVVMVGLSAMNLLPAWATILIVSREVVVVGTGLDLIRRGQKILPPTFGGRFVGLIFLVMEIFYLIDFTPYNVLVLFVALAAMSISFANYLRLYTKAIEGGEVHWH